MSTFDMSGTGVTRYGPIRRIVVASSSGYILKLWVAVRDE
jgi:hypothetical protein